MTRMLLVPLIALMATISGSLSAASISTLATNAIEASLPVLAAEFKKQTGHEVAIQFDTSPAIARRLAAGGATADVLVAAAGTVEQAIKDGRAIAATRASIGKVAVGVAISRGARRPDISSVDALKASLLQADAVVYSQGASGVYVERMLRDLGIADQLKGKVVQVPTGSDIMARLGARRGNEIGMTQVSEIKRAETMHAVTLVGPLPGAIQNYTLFDAVVMSGSGAQDAARAFVRALTTSAARKVLVSDGWEP